MATRNGPARQKRVPQRKKSETFTLLLRLTNMPRRHPLSPTMDRRTFGLRQPVNMLVHARAIARWPMRPLSITTRSTICHARSPPAGRFLPEVELSCTAAVTSLQAARPGVRALQASPSSDGTHHGASCDQDIRPSPPSTRSLGTYNCRRIAAYPTWLANTGSVTPSMGRFRLVRLNVVTKSRPAPLQREPFSTDQTALEGWPPAQSKRHAAFLRRVIDGLLPRRDIWYCSARLSRPP